MVEMLRELPALLLRDESFAAVVAALKRGDGGSVDGAWGSSRALAAAALADECPGPVLVVVSRPDGVDDMAADLAQFSARPVTTLPAWDTLPGQDDEHALADPTFGGRLRAVRTLEDGGPTIVVASLAALMQPVPSRAARAEASRTIAVGEELNLDRLCDWLESHRFHRTPAVREPGEFSLHGGILDVYPLDAADPLRLELFGDEVESIRSFDVQTQRKVDDLDEARMLVVVPAGTGEGSGEKGAAPDHDSPSPLSSSHAADSLPDTAWVVLPELVELQQEGRDYVNRLADARGLFTAASTMERLTRRPTCVIASIAGGSFETTAHLRVESIETFTRPKTEVAQELAETIGPDERMLLACHNEGERARLAELFGVESGESESGGTRNEGRGARGEKQDAGTDSSARSSEAGLGGRLTLTLGAVTAGFRWVNERLIVLGDHELWGRPDVRRVTKAKKQRDADRANSGRAIDSFLDLKEGDLVVHLAHGIGKYLGMEVLTQEDGRREEHLKLAFRGDVQVYVPVSLIHLVQKYVGATKKGAKGIGVQLSKLGGKTWSKQKEKVSEAVADMASDMIRMQAARELNQGYACGPDSVMVKEFAAAFPYVETPDQELAIADVTTDLQSHRPMDRLICGDVGFGKTEVAMRAAFKVADEGRQVAILVPTTVLAAQHEKSFAARMAEFPLNVAGLSRFKTKKEQNATLEALQRGGVDIVIGTHRLVSKDVKFKDLGLLVIDEEQRFGVGVKDKLKALRLDVPVLTLSATPIPRTLHMSLLGIRDISNLTTPPVDRVPVETRVCRFDADLIRSACVRELNRGGQIYFVHNRVYNIEDVAERIQSIVPEAKIVIGHGQMGDAALEAAMVEFVEKRADILVATTIIESGLDIPSANTMFINQADKYGLADLHQLRGRVGRYKHRAYCYLVLDEKTVLSGTSAKRMKAIEEFSDLGAGFQIAMRDLEIRGAGNILGSEQSGHITTVGYELYCQLLENAVRRANNQPAREFPHVTIDLPIEAFLPPDYVPPGRQKIDVYRRLSSTDSLTAVEEFHGELRDRFGPVPTPVENLLLLRRLEINAFAWSITDIRLEDGYVRFRYRDTQRMHDLGCRFGKDLRITDGSTAYLVYNRNLTGVPLAEWLAVSLAASSG